MCVCVCVYVYIYIYICILFSTLVLHLYSYNRIHHSFSLSFYSTLTLSLSLSIYIKLAILVEGDPKAPFSKGTTPRCRGGRYSFPGLLHFTLVPYFIMLSGEQVMTLVWLDLGLNPVLPKHWWMLYSLGYIYPILYFPFLSDIPVHIIINLHSYSLSLSYTYIYILFFLLFSV